MCSIADKSNPNRETLRLIHEHKHRWGVEPICRQLPIAPSTYHAAKKRQPSERGCGMSS